MLELFLCLGGALLQTPEPTQQDYNLGAASALDVLYAGFPEGPREAAFLALLERAFDKVGTIDLRELDSAAAAEYDVVIADWRPSYVDGAWTQDGRHGVKLERDFAKPILMVGDLAGTLPTDTKFRHL